LALKKFQRPQFLKNKYEKTTQNDHAHAQVAPRLKCAHQRHHERVVGEGHDVTLDKHLLQRVVQHQVLLLDLLHGEALLAHEVDGAVADQLDLLEVLFARLLEGVDGDGDRRAAGVLAVVVGEEQGVAVQAHFGDDVLGYVGFDDLFRLGLS